jgi:serine/threonine-protein kinase
MSPEQATGAQADTRSDVYSLGCVAFFALTGRAPFDDTSAAALLTKHASAPAPPLLSVRKSVPAAFAAAVDRCLAKNPDDRFASADDLAAAVRQSVRLHGDVPAPVRAFVADARSAGSEVATSLSAGAVSLALLGVAMYRASDAGFIQGLGFVLEMASYAGVAAAMGGLIVLRLAQVVASARRLLRSGYGHSAVAPTLLLEERAADEREPTRISRAGLLLPVAATALAIWLTDSEITPLAFVGLAGSIVIPTVALRKLFERGAGRGRWSRWLRGRLGRFVFRLARIRLGDTPETPSAGEPTALALGHAVEELFDALPDPQRRQFAEVPRLVAQLEADALALHARHGTPERDARYAGAIAAIETLRLDLLRMHASPSAGGDLTRDIDAARRVGDAIAESLRRVSGAGRA